MLYLELDSPGPYPLSLQYMEDSSGKTLQNVSFRVPQNKDKVL